MSINIKSIVILALTPLLFGCGVSNQSTTIITELEYKTNINTATISELMEFSGIGKVKANRIIDGRPYLDIYELIEKRIVGQKVFDNIKEDLEI